MRCTPRLTVILSLAIPLAACRDELPTSAGTALRTAPSAPNYALVDGPVTPTDGGTVTGPVVTIATTTSLDATPRVSGDLACYADFDSHTIGWYRFSTNTRALIAPFGDETEVECDVDGNHVAFGSYTASQAPTAPGVFDVTSSTITRIGPAITSPRYASIGSSTLAYVEMPSVGAPSKIRVGDLGTPATSTVLSAVALFEHHPTVSPNGTIVVWERAENAYAFSLMKSTRDPSSGAWSSPQLVTSGASVFFGVHDTDGSYVVWSADATAGGFAANIFIQAASGGPITEVVVPGINADPRIDKGVVVFQHASSTFANPEIMAYVVATNTLYHVAALNAFNLNVRNSDVSVLSSSSTRAVWVDPDPNLGVFTVYGKTFALQTSAPPPPPVFTFGGFQAPLTTGPLTAPAVVPVKFSLGGNFGLNIFVSGSPSSSPADCTTGTVTGASTPAIAQAPLTYDASTDTYLYRWKTDAAWKGACRKLTLTFTDNTSYSIVLQFR